jgi:uncharacterized protein
MFSHPGERYFVRRLASLVGEDSTNVSRELARLAEFGILLAVSEGRQRYYQVNTASPLYSDLRGLVLKTSGIAELLREALELLSGQIFVAFVFGSFAAGREAAASDVDLLVVGDVTLAEVAAALGPVQDRIGREVNPVVYPAAELREKLARGLPFLEAVLEGPKLFVIGSAHELDRLAEKRLAG